MVANILDAESMAVWKDVDGVLNADPKIFPDAVQIAELNYLDTIELAYSGAESGRCRTLAAPDSGCPTGSGPHR